MKAHLLQNPLKKYVVKAKWKKNLLFKNIKMHSKWTQFDSYRVELNAGYTSEATVSLPV